MPQSESVYLDCVSADGRSGFIARLARHTDEGESWLWLHGFFENTLFSYNRADLPCDGSPSRVDGTSATYLIEQGATARFERHGPAAAPTAAVVSVTCAAHEGLTAPESEGDLSLSVHATFHPDGEAGSNLPGRTEVLGLVEATVTAGGEVFDVAGRGHFHEQHQDTPRFTVPFTYGTLRGDGAGLVFIIGPRASGGFLRTGGEQRALKNVSISPVADHRVLRFDVEGGDSHELALGRTHAYELPIKGHPRDSSVVVAASPTWDTPLSGCVNDWQPPRPSST